MADVPFIVDAWRSLIDSGVSPFHLKTSVTFIIHELCYWSSFVPFIIFDRIPALHAYKVQPDKPATKEAVANCARRVITTHLLLVLPIIMATHPLFDLMGARHEVEHMPTLAVMLGQIVLFFAMEDFIFYFGHRALHTPWLYKNVHSIHHEHSAPFGIAAEYAHPAEVMFLGLATILPPMLVGPHLLTLFAYLALRCMQTVECHSGYDLPFSPNKWLPLYGGARFHDHHHRIHSGNYSSTFIWVDYLFRTDTSYRIWEARQLEKAKLAAKIPSAPVTEEAEKQD